jgi:hypothetical protein
MMPFSPKGYDAGWTKNSYFRLTTCQEDWSGGFICGTNSYSGASKNSLTSWWVEDEIKTTLEKERALRKERGKPVHKLIPLNLDGYMFTDEWDLGVLANGIRSRVAADFREIGRSLLAISHDRLNE